MTALLMIAAFMSWLLYSFVFSSGKQYASDFHYDVPNIDEAAPLNPTAAREVIEVLAATQVEPVAVTAERR